MLKKIRIYLYNHLGFSKSESNGLIVLAILILLVAIVPRLYFRFFMPPIPKPDLQSNFSSWIVKRETSKSEKGFAQPVKNGSKPDQKQKNTSRKVFRFDPNIATIEELKSLGFKEYVAQRIEKYRRAGGSFRSKDDLLKIYGIDSSLVTQLHAYLNLDSQLEEKPTDKKKRQTIALAEAVKKTDINQADSELLEKVYGVGTAFANRIIRFRDALGGFHSMDQLREVYHLPDSTIRRIAVRFEISEPGSIATVDINSMGEDSLRRHPYINFKLARVIVNYRAQHGPFQNVEELKSIKPLTDSLYQKLYPYLSVNRTRK